MGCSSTENRDKVNAKKDEVMQIHDIAMEKMSDMAKLKKELKQQLASDSTSSDSIVKAINNLDEADKIMWDWMHNYHHEIVDTSSIEEALKYLNQQYLDVKIVEEKINKSLQNGEKLL